MKLVLEFDIRHRVISVEYRKIFMHFLKRCIGNANEGKYYDTYYGGVNTKNFTFSVFFQEPKYEKKEIKLSGTKVKMIFSTSEQRTGYFFYASFLEQKNKKIQLEQDNQLTLKKVTQIAESIVKSDKVLIKMNSPLVIRNHQKEQNKDFYYSFVRPEFQKKAIEIITNQLQQEGFQETYCEGFHITPIKCKKTVVCHYGCMIEATLGVFLLEGDKSILNYLLQAGIGSRRSECFGMGELIEEVI